MSLLKSLCLLAWVSVGFGDALTLSARDITCNPANMGVLVVSPLNYNIERFNHVTHLSLVTIVRKRILSTPTAIVQRLSQRRPLMPVVLRTARSGLP